MSGTKRMRARSSDILSQVVACLTGMPQDAKERLHGLIEAMGGRFTRDLNSVENTHLVACEASGAKYEAAVQMGCSISIVRPSWIEACWRLQQLTDCREHLLTTELEKGAVRAPPHLVSFESALNQQLLDTVHRDTWLFSAFHFSLVGFKEDDIVFGKLTRLIRRCMGTIYWENCTTICDAITHVIVNNDYMDEAAHDAVINRGPAFVSPRWVVDSCRDGKILPSSNYLPEYRVLVAKEKPTVDKLKTATGRLLLPPIFRGSVFVLLRVVPPEWAVDFDSTELEAVITQHDGQMLSQPLLDALRSDHAADPTTKRTCYVICWGGVSTHDLHPLLAQVKRYQLCDVQPVTPIWLQTCATEQKCLQPSRLPELFQPNNRPIYSFAKLLNGRGKQLGEAAAPSIRISVTGFSGSQRSALIHLIAAMGGVYDDSMRTATTHLICARADGGAGQKYAKAVEWKLHIVTVAWLYHVVRYGLSHRDDGDGNDDDELPSIEERFAVVAPPLSDH